MARPKKYQRDEVVGVAMNAFWEKGFHGTSLADLVAATGLNKKSLYAEFGSKEGLFQAALQLYTDFGGQEATAFLDQEPYGLENIRRYFRSMSYEPNCRGCLMNMTINEKQLAPPDSMALIGATFELIQGLFVRNLKAAYEAGQIESLADCQRLATFLLFSIQGITTMGKYKGEQAQLELVVETILSVLGEG